MCADPRVLFTLVCSSARDIQRYSAMGRAESEFVMPPGCCWRVESKCDAGHGLTIVQLTELPHKNMLTFKPPGSLFPHLPPPEAAPAPAPSSATSLPASFAAGGGAALDPKVEALADALVSLNVGLKKACALSVPSYSLLSRTVLAVSTLPIWKLCTTGP